MKLFLDTNLLIDYYLRRKPFFDPWVQLRVMQAFGDAELWVSAKSFTDVFYIGKKYVDGAELQKAFAKSLGFLSVCSINREDILIAADLSWPDFEDCLVFSAAQKVKADYILTRDAEGFSQSSVPVYSPADFFAHLEHKKGLVYDTVALTRELAQ